MERSFLFTAGGGGGAWNCKNKNIVYTQNFATHQNSEIVPPPYYICMDSLPYIKYKMKRNLVFTPRSWLRLFQLMPLDKTLTSQGFVLELTMYKDSGDLHLSDYSDTCTGIGYWAWRTMRKNIPSLPMAFLTLQFLTCVLQSSKFLLIRRIRPV